MNRLKELSHLCDEVVGPSSSLEYPNGVCAATLEKVKRGIFSDPFGVTQHSCGSIDSNVFETLLIFASSL
jgi:hypothetical protein